MHARLAAILLGAISLACAHAPQPICERIGDMRGSEDLDVIDVVGAITLLVSADARREGQSSDRDGIWAIPWPGGTPTLLGMKRRDACSINFHGMTAAEVTPSEWEVWVINHHDPADASLADCTLPQHEGKPLLHTIEHFRLTGDGLRFLERLGSPLLTNPNDLDATPDRRLWISNNPDWDPPKQALGDVLLRRKHGYVVRYDPAAEQPWLEAAEGFVYTNGVLVEGNTLWVGSYLGLERIELGPEGVEGSTRERIRLKGAVDNIMRDDEGLWIAAHAKPLKFVKHAEDPRKHAPTRVYRVTTDSDPERSVVLDVREQPDAGATALRLPEGDRASLAIGQVFEPGVWICPLP
ncbi:hypothetical protein ACNOYE_03480 [Nannocystaceae bacterium ST9]